MNLANAVETSEIEEARLATYPAPYPEGWYVVAREKDLATKPTQVRVAGNDVVLFRDAEGQARAIEAYCPHMGANLSDGKVIPRSGATAKVRLEGPGGIIRFDFRIAANGGRVVMFQSHTPTGPLTQRVRFRWFSDQSVSKLQAAFIVGNWVSQWRQDLGIWSRKIYRKHPLLSRADGPVHQLRRWYAHFYPAR